MIDAGFMNRMRADYQFKRFLKKWDVIFDDKGEAKQSLIGSFVISTYRVNRAPFLNEQIRRVLVERFGEDVVKKGGLSVYTTIDASKQDIALNSLREGVLKQRAYHIKRASQIKSRLKAEKEKEKADSIEGALVAINPNTGEIISYVGGFEFSTANQLDHVSQIRRQPGSSFKPIVYAAAIENRDITPSTILIDEKTVFEGGYSPSNYDGKYVGRVIAREALTKSINVIAVKVLQLTGYDKIFDILQDGLTLSRNELHERFGKTLSLTLGTYELSPLENCVLHSIIVNGGDFIMPYGIRYVNDYNGNVVWNNEAEIKDIIDERRRKLGKIINPTACAVTISMLKGVLEEGGTAYYAVKYKKIKFPIAGKTGTSTNFNDAWFIGYTSDLVVAIWVGNKEGAISLGSGRSGGVIAAPIWSDYISRIYGDNPPGEFNIPDEGFTKQTICLDSGLVPRSEGLCPRVALDQLFYSGTEPGEYCDIHTKEEKTDTVKRPKK
jgi:penicillin-binding protein 1A